MASAAASDAPQIVALGGDASPSRGIDVASSEAMTKARLVHAALIASLTVAAVGCVEDEGKTDEAQCPGKCDESTNGGADHASLRTGLVTPGSAMFVAHCRQEGGTFACFPTLMKFDPSQPTGVRTVALPRVDQARTAPSAVFKATVIDPKRGLAYLHAGCTSTYIVTDLRTGSSTVFPTPGVACLQSMVYDQDRDRIIALGGAVSAGTSTIDSVLEIGPAGQTSPLFDIRAQVPRALSYLHPFKELVSYDRRRGLLYTPLLSTTDPNIRSMLRVNVTTGAASVLPWISGVQHQFYDDSMDTTFAYDCRVPDMLRVDSFSPLGFTGLFDLDFGPRTIDVICRDGFTGAVYDAARKHQLILFRLEDDRFTLAVSDLQTREFVGLFPTDANAQTFRHGPIAPTEFWSTGFVPPLDGEIVRRSTDTPIAIPDNQPSGITSTLTVADSTTISNLSVDVNITHTWRGDLFVNVVCPDGTRAPLHQGTGQGARNLVQTFDVTACNGRSAAGTWKLEVSDRAARDRGVLNGWTLRVR